MTTGTSTHVLTKVHVLTTGISTHVLTTGTSTHVGPVHMYYVLTTGTSTHVLTTGTSTGCASCNFIAVLATTHEIYPKFHSFPCYYIYIHIWTPTPITLPRLRCTCRVTMKTFVLKLSLFTESIQKRNAYTVFPRL